MSQQRNSPITLTAGEDLSAFRRVKISGSTIVYADSTDHGFGVVQQAVDYSEEAKSCIRMDVEGSSKMVASGAISAGADVYAANDGKIASSGTVEIGKAVEASTANGDVIEVIPHFDKQVSVSDVNVWISDYVWTTSDVVTNSSDIVVIKSDLTAAKSDITVIKSDITSNDSDITVIKSDVTTGASDITTHTSDLRVAISDALLAHAAGDWANVSDIKVTVAEIIAAFSDALG